MSFIVIVFYLSNLSVGLLSMNQGSGAYFSALLYNLL